MVKQPASQRGSVHLYPVFSWTMRLGQRVVRWPRPLASGFFAGSWKFNSRAVTRGFSIPSRLTSFLLRGTIFLLYSLISYLRGFLWMLA